MPRPELEVLRQAEQLAYRRVQRVRVATGEVATRGADIGVEQGVPAKDVGWVYRQCSAAQEGFETIRGFGENVHPIK
jgi:hypothetical protein